MKPPDEATLHKVSFMIMECEGTRRNLFLGTRANGRQYLVDREVFTSTEPTEEKKNRTQTIFR